MIHFRTKEDKGNNMYIEINDRLKDLTGGIAISPKKTAFPISAIPQVFDLALENQWIILGGDVLTPEFKATYDNWFYEPDKKRSLVWNAKQSIEESMRYISAYVKRNGENFLFIFTISNTYIEGKLGEKQTFLIKTS